MVAPPRILLTTDAVGGVWTYTRDLACGLSAQGVDVTVATLGPPPSCEQRDAARDIRLRVTTLPLDWTADNPAALAAAGCALASLAAREGAGSVHLHAPALAAAPFGVPVVAVAHSCVATWWDAVHGGELPVDLAWRAEAAARGLGIADAVIAPSRAFASALCRRYALTRAVDVVHNGIAQHTPPPASEQRNAGTILTAGRLWDAAKDIATIDHAAALLDVQIAAAGPLAGPGGFAAHFPHLRLLGTLTPTALRRAMGQAAIFVSLARYEPFGLAVLEAAAEGCALLLSDIPTFRELWNGAARFVSPGEPAAAAAQLRALRADRAEAERLGLLARERAVRYAAAMTAEATLAVHRRIADQRRAA